MFGGSVATRDGPVDPVAAGRTGSNTTALVALGLAGASTAAVSLLTLNRAKDVVIAASLHGQALRPAAVLSALGPADAVALLLAVGSLLSLPWLELRYRSFTRLLETARPGEAVVLLLLLLAWLGHAYLNPGVLLGGDIGTHISRIHEVRRGLESGALPFWTNYQYAGSPLLWFTGPLPFVVGGVLDLALRDAVLTTKLLLFALHMLAGMLFYAWLRRLALAPVPAVMAAATFAGSFAHLHLFLYRGVLPQAFTLVFLVLLFYAADGLCRERGGRRTNVLLLVLATAGLVVNHQPHAPFAALYLALFGAVALLTGFWRWRGVAWVGLAGIAGVASAAIAVLPLLAEADWVMVEPGATLFALQLPAPSRLLNLVLWRNVRTNWGADSWAYLGLGAVVFGAAGLTGLFRRRLTLAQRGVALPAVCCLALCFFLANPVVRDVIFLLFFLSLLAAVGLDWLIGAGRLAGRWLLAAVALLVLDLASTSVQPVARSDKGFLAEAGRYLERTAPNERFAALIVRPGELDPDIRPDGGPMSYDSTVQRVAGNHNLAATRLHNFLVTPVEQASTDLMATGRLAPETADALGLFNVARIICLSPVAAGCPDTLRDAVVDPVLGRIVPLAASPVLFSRTLTLRFPDPALSKPVLWDDDFRLPREQARIAAIRAMLRSVLRIERPDFANRTAAALAVQYGVPAGAAPPPQQPWHPVLHRYEVGLDRVRLEVSVDAAGFVQLAHPWIPSWQVTVNGAPVQPIRGTVELMVLPLSPGRSVIELRDGWTQARRLGAATSAAGLLLALVIIVVAGQRRTRG